ncbi:hypothetical protein IG631_09532 [Alternaria alternata]|jgi:hypothetical protein|nr:hypothetical protein IG631_09532 [Alternaria alternata]
MNGWQDSRVERRTLGSNNSAQAHYRALASSREGPNLQDKIHNARGNGWESCKGEGGKPNGCSVAEEPRTESRGADKEAPIVPEIRKSFPRAALPANHWWCAAKSGPGVLMCNKCASRAIQVLPTFRQTATPRPRATLKLARLWQKCVRCFMVPYGRPGRWQRPWAGVVVVVVVVVVWRHDEKCRRTRGPG